MLRRSHACTGLPRLARLRRPPQIAAVDASTACSGGEAAERTDLTVGLATLKSGYFCRIGETQRAGTHIGGCRPSASRRVPG